MTTVTPTTRESQTSVRQDGYLQEARSLTWALRFALDDEQVAKGWFAERQDALLSHVVLPSYYPAVVPFVDLSVPA